MEKEKDISTKKPDSEVKNSVNTLDEMNKLLGVLVTQVCALTEDVKILKNPVVEVKQDSVLPQRLDSGGFDKVKGYIKMNKGYPMKPGESWHDMTIAERKQHLINHENRWKLKYTERAQNLGGGEMSWTRGNG